MFTTLLVFAVGAAAKAVSGDALGSVEARTFGNFQVPSLAGFTSPTVQLSRGGGAICVSGFIPVQASTTKNLKFNFAIPQNQTQVTNTFVEMVSADSGFMQEINGGTQTVSGTYQIEATLCTPTNNTKPTTVEILTHGVGFDRHYWDFAPGYSYVDVAASYGHASFFYDRLGVGQSQKPDAIQVVQAPLEVEILHSLITMVKSGSFSGITPSKVVGTGHSFGSILTEAITSQYPTILDTAILTGFSTNSTGQQIFIIGLNSAIASLNQPFRFAGLSNGYLVSDTAISNQIAFFRAPGFDSELLYAAEATKGTVTFGELFSIGSVIAPAIGFTGAIAVVNGVNDLPFCTGNCQYPVNLADETIATLYPNPKAKGSYLAPISGHGVNLHYSATAAFDYIQDFIAQN